MVLKIKKKLYPVGRKIVLTFETVFPYEINANDEYAVGVTPLAGFKTYAMSKQGKSISDEVRACFYQPLPLSLNDGTLTAALTLPQEDRYKIIVTKNGALIEKTEICALDDDLYGSLPLKGDNHMHSYFSDGSESPEYLGAFCRRRGFDFITIADHGLLNPSVVARDWFDQRPTDFFVIPGEEVHSPGNNVHILNIGGSESVNQWSRVDHTEQYEALVQQELANVPAEMDENNRYMAAASKVMFDRIRGCGGVAVLCHPHWIVGHGFNQPEDLTEWFMETVPFDAVELIAGGAREEGIFLQLADSKSWPDVPVLGHSDAHSSIYTSLKIGTYTIVFAREATAEGVKQAIREGRCVCFRDDRYYGSYRYVKLAYFLREHVYKDHDAMCEREGDFLVKCVMGIEARKDDLLPNYSPFGGRNNYIKTVDYYKGLYY